MIKIKEIWFSDDQIFGRGEDGRIYSQSLLWYPRLRAASAEEQENNPRSRSAKLRVAEKKTVGTLQKIND